MSCTILALTCFFTYITATFMLEAMSVGQNVKDYPGAPPRHVLNFSNDDATQRLDTDSEEINVETGVRHKKSLFSYEHYNSTDYFKGAYTYDEKYKQSKYYIRKKLEIAQLGERLGPPWLKYAIAVILALMLYGAMALKYASGA